MSLYWSQLVAGASRYESRRNQHRPTDAVQLVAEIRRLAATGLHARDISVALRLDHAYVVQALQGAQ